MIEIDARSISAIRRGAFAGFTVAHVPLLSSGITAHYGEVVGDMEVLVTGAGGNQNDVADVHRVQDARFTAELDLGRTAVAGEDFVRGAVIMVKRVDGVPPRPAPLVVRQQLLNEPSWIVLRQHEGVRINEEWTVWVVRDRARVFQRLDKGSAHADNGTGLHDDSI